MNLLDAQTIRNAQPKPDKNYTLLDGGGLFLLVCANGSKLWRLKHAKAMRSLGVYPSVTLAQARSKRDSIRQANAAGAGMPAQQTASPNFEQVARDWHTANKGRWSSHHATVVLRALESNVFGQIGSMPITSITKPLVVEKVVAPFEQRGVIERGQRVVQHMVAIFDWADGRGITLGGFNPCRNITFAPRKPVSSRAALTELSAVREMLQKYEREPKFPMTALANRFTALTAMRQFAIRHAEFSQIVSGDNPVWDIPTQLMKGERGRQRPLMIPLSRQAVEVISAARSLAEGRYLFAGSVALDQPLSENTVNDSLKAAGFDGIHTGHGWRSTFSTIMNERHPDLHAVIEFCLGHKVPGVAGIYNRAEYLDKRRALMQEYADLLFQGLPTAAELLSMRRK